MSKRNYRRKRYSKGKYCTKRELKKVERKLQGEVKTFITSTTNSFVHPLTGTPIRNPIPLIIQGDTVQNREGNKVKILHFGIKGIIKQDTAVTHQNVRIMIFKDTQNNGTLPTMAQLLFSTVADRNMVTHLNMQYRSRFKVLYDRLFALTVTDKIEIGFEKKFSQSYTMNYSGNTGGIADFNGSGYFIYAWSDEPTVNYPTLTYSVQLKFIDN